VSFKVPVVQRPEYTIYLQDIEGTTWAHCDVHKWSPSICRRLKADANTVYELHGGPIFALNEPAGCQKHVHFLRVMGFEFVKEVDGPQFIYKR